MCLESHKYSTVLLFAFKLHCWKNMRLKKSNFAFTSWLFHSCTKPMLWLADILQRPNCNLIIEPVGKEGVQTVYCHFQVIRSRVESSRGRIPINKKPREKTVIPCIATQSGLSVELWRSPKPVLFYFVILIWHLILKSETLPHSWHNCSWESKSVKEYLSNRPYLKHLNTGKLTGNQTWPMLLQTPANLHRIQESRSWAEAVASQQENSLERGLIQKKKLCTISIYPRTAFT